MLNRAFNLVFAGLSLLLLSVVLFTLALAIKLMDNGPILYRQQRMGKNLRKFYVLKFRSMRVGEDCGSLLTSAGDKRTTRVGRFLRSCKLDELPQLINVLKGEMQLVGPRPEVERYVEMFGAEYATLLKEPPGLTDPASLAYINESDQRSGSDPEEQYISQILPNKLRLSLEYRQRRTLLSDIGIICRTLLAVFSRRPASALHHSYN